MPVTVQKNKKQKKRMPLRFKTVDALMGLIDVL